MHASFSQAHLHHLREQQYLLGVLASGKEALDAQDLRRKHTEVCIHARYETRHTRLEVVERVAGTALCVRVHDLSDAGVREQGVETGTATNKRTSKSSRVSLNGAASKLMPPGECESMKLKSM